MVEIEFIWFFRKLQFGVLPEAVLGSKAMHTYNFSYEFKHSFFLLESGHLIKYSLSIMGNDAHLIIEFSGQYTFPLIRFYVKRIS